MHKISRVILLVHPFFSLTSHNPLNQNQRITRENIDFLAGLWGKQIKEAQQNPNAIFVLVNYLSDSRWFIPKKTGYLYALKKLERMINFAKKNLGDRFFFISGNILPKELASELARRKMAIDRSIFSGESFGEWWRNCVDTETKRLASALKVSQSRISKKSGLSVTVSSSPLKLFDSDLGRMSDMLRAKAAKHRRRSRKRISRKR